MVVNDSSFLNNWKSMCIVISVFTLTLYHLFSLCVNMLFIFVSFLLLLSSSFFIFFTLLLSLCLTWEIPKGEKRKRKRKRDIPSEYPDTMKVSILSVNIFLQTRNFYLMVDINIYWCLSFLVFFCSCFSFMILSIKEKERKYYKRISLKLR